MDKQEPGNNTVKIRKRRPGSDRIELPHVVRQKQVANMYHTTGFTKAELAGLRDRIAANRLNPGMRPWPPILGLRIR